MHRWTPVAVLGAALAMLVGLTAAPAVGQAAPSALPCENIAHLPSSDGHARAKADVQRRGGGCGNATVEITIWADLSLRPDVRIAHNKQFFSQGFLGAAGACYNGFGHVRGIYTEMHVNGQKVAESGRAPLPGCVA
ncbi:hypothetical protein [Streptomyces aureocirculatus]|uniref:hypothetical protein n=1 Tax=Streptomyces aureocirculatus TaxID=67275 RepID=UPI0012FEBA4E|nr:hypothetical protein [Streptomyces aureocirculatus]GGR87114.1 hypothetical protein GCM10010252_27320 [Streptomyces aureoverticillatus]